MKKLILFLSVLSLSFHACKKDPVEPDPNGETPAIKHLQKQLLVLKEGYWKQKILCSLYRRAPLINSNPQDLS